MKFRQMPSVVSGILSKAWIKQPDPLQKVAYLTFDDGPHPDITPWVAEQLSYYNAKATFFLIGQNMDRYRDLSTDWYHARGHCTGHHTYNHLNGLKVSNQVYYANVERCAGMVKSQLFRPPYGKLRPSQYRYLSAMYQIVLWHLVTYDFDRAVTPERIVKHLASNTENGSIIVFHDSEKASKNLQKALPEILGILSDKGFSFKGLTETSTQKSE